MDAYKGNIEELTLKNTYFRQVVYTATHSQLVVMCLKPMEEIGEEIHEKVDQFFRFEQGTGKTVINGVEQNISEGDVLIIPAGTKHNIINSSSTVDLKLYTVYSPPNHRDGTIHKTKAEALADEKDEY